MLTAEGIPNHTQGVFPIKKYNLKTGEVKREYNFFSGVMLNPDVVSLDGLDPAIVGQHWTLIRKLACVENSAFDVLVRKRILAQIENLTLTLRRELNPAIKNDPTFSTGYNDFSIILLEILKDHGINAEIVLPAVHLNLWRNTEEYKAAFDEFRTSPLMHIPYLKTRAIAIENAELLLRRQWEGLEFAQWSSEYLQRIEIIKKGIGIDDEEILRELSEFGGIDIRGWSEPIVSISEKIPKNRKLLEFIERHGRDHTSKFFKYLYNDDYGSLYVQGRMTAEEFDELLGIYANNEVRNAIRRLYHQSQVGKRTYQYVYSLYSEPFPVRANLAGTQIYQKPIYLAA